MTYYIYEASAHVGDNKCVSLARSWTFLDVLCGVTASQKYDRYYCIFFLIIWESNGLHLNLAPLGWKHYNGSKIMPIGSGMKGSNFHKSLILQDECLLSMEGTFFVSPLVTAPTWYQS